MTLALMATLFAATQFGNFLGEAPAERVDDPVVFKTHTMSFPDVKQKGKLIIDINRGFVEVEGYDGNEVVIELLTPPRFLKDKDEEAEFQTLFTPKYDLDPVAKDNAIKFDAYNQDYVLNLRVKVPYKTDLSLDSYRSGHIKAKNIAGTVHTHSQHCDITLLDIAGSATAYSYNGCLKVEFHEVADDAELDFETYNGWIDLSLPDTTAVSTAIASGASNCVTAFTIEPVEGKDRPESILSKIGKNVDEYQFGKINGGGVPLRIENAKGEIKIRKTGRSE